MTSFNQQSQNVDKQYNAGKDQFIQNIVLVGQFLDYAKIEGLIPKSSGTSDFHSVITAFEQTFDKRLGSDLAHATATAGEILRYSIEKWLPRDSFSALPIKEILEDIPYDIYSNLDRLHMWNAFFETKKGSYNTTYEFLRLSSLEILWKKYFNDDCVWGIIHRSSSSFDTWFSCENKTFLSRFNSTTSFSLLNIESITYEKFRVLLAGLVIDLIRISSVASDDVKFWNNIAELLKINTTG